ncbi:hypothetical protein [uncultured Shewanella sp.]|uniref:hypothetical protein n=1 Tax=uncultured Shewanella sp. TaxID=173975 RepID=UPI0026139DBC|nr:hypothetical protein [uncultured Shewanella sp.]
MSKIQRVASISAIIVTLFTGLPAIWYTAHCSSKGINCERSLFGPKVEEIQQKQLATLVKSGHKVTDIIVEKFDPLFSKPFLEVSARTAPKGEILGFIPTGDKGHFEFSKFEQEQKYVLASSTGKTSRFDIFDTSNILRHTFVLSRCTRFDHNKLNIKITNFRWNYLPDEKNIFSFDLISNCHKFLVNGLEDLNFGGNSYYKHVQLYPELNGRVYLEFGRDFILSRAYTREGINRSKEIERYKSKINEAKGHFDVCVDELKNRNRSGDDPNFCSVYFPHHPDSSQSKYFRKGDAFAFTPQKNTHKTSTPVIGTCKYGVERLSNIEIGNFGVKCTNPFEVSSHGETETDIDGLEISMYIDTGFSDIKVLNFRSDSYHASLEGVEVIDKNTIEFDVYSSSKLLSFNSHVMVVELEKKAAQVVLDKKIFRGRFSISFHEGGAVKKVVRI